LAKNKYWLHILLFVLTFISTTISGVYWSGNQQFDLTNFSHGLKYSILLLIFLSAHEFGHYFAARIHKVDATLPYYIPFPHSETIPSPFGTFGAIIKTRSPILTRKALFDIGVSGPIAGFIVSVGFLIYGLITLPPVEYLYHIHPEYITRGHQVLGLYFGDTLILSALADIFANPNGWMPTMNEIYHYPFLNVGWFGMFVTSLNMLPLGQLDGGHVLYAMFGKKQYKISTILWYILLAMGIFGLFSEVYNFFSHPAFINEYPTVISILQPIHDGLKSISPYLLKFWPGWLIWALITKFFIKIKHPPLQDDEPLDTKRMAIGWFAFLILVLTFSYNGIYIIGDLTNLL
jgi:membrane-associated protease RseP (regulator of RpoE activity)